MTELTIKQAILQLQKIATTSVNGDNTVLCVCIPGIEYQMVREIKLSDGMALIMQPFDLEDYDSFPVQD